MCELKLSYFGASGRVSFSLALFLVNEVDSTLAIRHERDLVQPRTNLSSSHSEQFSQSNIFFLQ